MKITEFNKHYKSYFPVGEGWRPLVEKLVNNICAIDKKVEILQIKEKFGTLRFYINGGNDKIYKLIEEAEAESGKICEHCGSREDVTTEGDWILTLCNKCRQKRGKL